MKYLWHRASFLCWGAWMFFVWRKRLGYWDFDAAKDAILMPYKERT